MTPTSRITKLNDLTPNPDGDYVLYWMIANRRSQWNFSLDRALDLAKELNKPLLVLEALRVGYPWASDRLHQFIVDGMTSNQQAFADSPAYYYAYLEPEEGLGKGLLKALSEKACALITDDFPCFFLPRMVDAVALRANVSMEMVDSNGLYPMRLAPKTFSRAVDFRRHLQKVLEPHLHRFPNPRPLAGLSLPKCPPPEQVLERWPQADLPSFHAADYPIDHGVPPVKHPGGCQAGQHVLLKFLRSGLSNYNDDRNHPQQKGTSGLSPYLHFGHISTHQVFSELADKQKWKPQSLSLTAKGQREGWWGMSPNAEAYLDQIVTWRELGYNMCCREANYDQWESLPAWAIKTLLEHADDPREYVYDLEQFEHARTHDELWNAAQNQLRREGHIHNYLRMLWAKKILHWSEHPKQALAIALHLNNKYSTDGRNPNSYSGVFWTFGRYDRAWGPERPIFGKIRYMTSDSTRRKYKVADYISKFADQASLSSP
jgi:deoxyribodipyrimidine photo-lyase